MTQLTDTGLVVTRLSDRIANLTTAFQTIFGLDLVTDPDSPDGQLIGVFAESLNNLEMLLGQIYGMFDPNAAVGDVLHRLVQINGISALPGTFSSVTLTLGGTASTVIDAGTLFHSATTGAAFALDAAATIPGSGTVDATATAVVLGAQAAPAGTISGSAAIDTPIFGLQTVNNVAAATLGRDPETDGQLRLRRSRSVAGSAQSVLDSIFSAVDNLDGVLHAKIYENDKPLPDPVTGQAANSIHVVVDGGAPADIVQAVFLKKTVGIPTLGALSGTVMDSQGRPHTINFDRPTDVDVFVVVNISQRPGFPLDGAAQIQAAIVAWAEGEFDIGQEVIQSDIYSPVSTVPNKSISSIFIGTAAGPTTTANIEVALSAIARFDLSRIVVNVS